MLAVFHRISYECWHLILRTQEVLNPSFDLRLRSGRDPDAVHPPELILEVEVCLQPFPMKG